MAAGLLGHFKEIIALKVVHILLVGKVSEHFQLSLHLTREQRYILADIHIYVKFTSQVSGRFGNLTLLALMIDALGWPT